MVRTIIRSLALLCLILPLASCIFIFSAFPPLLTQVMARTDLSAVIPAGSAGDYQVYCASTTAAPPGEFVLLMNGIGSADPRVIVLDANLNLIQTYTQTQLNIWGAFTGSTIMEEADGNIEIGNFGFSATNLLTIGINPSWNANGSVHGPSWSSPYRQSNVVNFHVNAGTQLSFRQYQPWWAIDYNATINIKATPDTQFNVAGAFIIDDSTTTAGKAIVVLSEQGNPTLHFISIPRDDFFFNTVQTPLFDNYPHASYSQMDTSSVGLAGDCLVAYSYQDHAMVRFSLTPPFNIINKLPIGETPNKITYGYKADGRYSVQLDQGSRILTKVARWW